MIGADDRARTDHIRITRAVLYHMSYVGVKEMVEMTGIEPAASGSRSRRSTKLNYISIVKSNVLTSLLIA